MESEKLMKTKIILTMGLTAVLATGVLCFAAPERLNATETNAPGGKIIYYSCPMHPSVNADRPGDCPICGMHLVPFQGAAKATNAPPIMVKTNMPVTMPGCCSQGGCCR